YAEESGPRRHEFGADSHRNTWRRAHGGSAGRRRQNRQGGGGPRRYRMQNAGGGPVHPEGAGASEKEEEQVMARNADHLPFAVRVAGSMGMAVIRRSLRALPAMAMDVHGAASGTIPNSLLIVAHGANGRSGRPRGRLLSRYVA